MHQKNHTGAQSVTPDSIHRFLFVSTLEDCQSRENAHADGASPPSPPSATGQSSRQPDTRPEKLTEALAAIGLHITAGIVRGRFCLNVIASAKANSHAE